ncbi:peptidoglycan-binding protein [Streptomyces blastmyceticus]|uniref:Peptidoglycan binding-like domain-containing protein n=1 Tax=Streptomyces blastmyceticus TaxID=68180 RepID=A0ABN0WSC3_9ACTN
MTLQSALLGDSPELVDVEAGNRTLRSGDTGDPVTRVQTALLAAGQPLPGSGVDGNFGPETETAVTAFKTAQGLSPTDPVVGVDTVSALDVVVGLAEGAVELSSANLSQTDLLTASSADLLFASSFEDSLKNDLLQLDPNKLCFPVSEFITSQGAAWFGFIAEAIVFRDYCAQLGGCTLATEWSDVTGWLIGYADFLKSHHPTLSLPTRTILLSQRPDFLSDRPPVQEFYEVKPRSLTGITKGLSKIAKISAAYGLVGLPYTRGTTYKPTAELPVASFTVQGIAVDVRLGVRLDTPGLITYTMCLHGDLARLLQTVRLAALVVAIVIALRGLLPETFEPNPGVQPVMA